MKKILMIMVLAVLCSFTFSGGCSTPPRLDNDTPMAMDAQEESTSKEDTYLVECIDSFFDTVDSILDVQISQDEREFRTEQKDMYPSYYEDRPLYEIQKEKEVTQEDVPSDIVEVSQEVIEEDVKETPQEVIVDVMEDEVQEIEVLPCFPSCVGKQCGDNGCGGSCGECPCEDCNPFWMLCGPDFTCVLAT